MVQRSDVWFRPKYLWGTNMRCLGCRWVCLKVFRYMLAKCLSSLRAFVVGICVHNGLNVLTDMIRD